MQRILAASRPAAAALRAPLAGASRVSCLPAASLPQHRQLPPAFTCFVRRAAVVTPPAARCFASSSCRGSIQLTQMSAQTRRPAAVPATPLRPAQQQTAFFSSNTNSSFVAASSPAASSSTAQPQTAASSLAAAAAEVSVPPFPSPVDAAAFTVAPVPSGLLFRLLPSSAHPYLLLARVDKPVGTWLLLLPCWWGVALAASPGSLPSLSLMALLGAGAFVMRGAGCTINDLWDSDFDRRVERTKERPIASGIVTVKQAGAFLGIQLGMGLIVVTQLNAAALV